QAVPVPEHVLGSAVLVLGPSSPSGAVFVVCPNMAERGRPEWQLEVDFLKERLAGDQVDDAVMDRPLPEAAEGPEFSRLARNERQRTEFRDDADGRKVRRSESFPEVQVQRESIGHL